jgi:hypothetical protein
MTDKKQNPCGCGCMPNTQKSENKNSASPKQEDKKPEK